MTNDTSAPTPKAEDPRARILSRYEGLSFQPAARPARREGNFSRGARKSNRKTRTIL